MQYALGYNPFHKLQSIGVAGVSNPLVTYGYKNKNGRLKSVTYANGDKMEATYNRFGQLITETWLDSSDTVTHKYTYAYDGQGNLIRTLDTITEARYNYMYEDGRLIRVSQWDNNLLTATVLYEYDENGKLEKKRIRTVFGEDRVYSYSTGENDASVVQFQVPMAGASNGQTTVTSQSRTDAFGRKVSDQLQFGTGTVSRQFSYHTGAVTQTHRDRDKVKGVPTTHLVSCIALSGGRTLCYKYDGEERIVEVDDSELGTTFYEYDVMGQLVKETFRDKTTGTETVVSQMTYDGYGNILTKNGVSYGYSNSSWKDLLTSYGSDTISYDAQGNPVSYRGRTLTWEKGRQLKSIHEGDPNSEGPTSDYSYTYNASGIRTSKTVDGVTHTYLLDGAKILQETWGNHTLVPLYDTEESVCGIVYNGETYFFQKNLQGDVIGIVNTANETVAKYTYDAWGKCTLTWASSTIGTINPFRYRGYYYDTETELYYVSSRYYDPEIGRWINADEATCLGASGTILGYNLFAYCENDAINLYDPTGHYEDALVLSGSLIASMSSALSGIMTSIRASVAGIKTAITTSWFIPVCVAAAAVAIVGIVYVVNRVNCLIFSATQTITAVKAKIKAGGIDPKKLKNYTVYVIVRKGTIDVVYVGITQKYSARKSKHTGVGKRFPTSKYTMMPIATGLSKSQARAMEQTIITAYTLDTLKNMINSISPKKWSNFTTEFNQMTTLIQSWIDPE